VRRLFWLALGATAGVLVVRKVNRVAHSYTPAGLAERADGLGDAIRYFADEVRAGMLEREVELRAALGLDGEADDAAGRPAAAALPGSAP
jgi:Family of unknown function (DUF6167)